MKRLIIVCEGPTEQEFCKDVLFPYFQSKGIILEYPTIKHSNGGIVPWATIKKQLQNHLYEGNTIVSMLIDFYRIKDSYSFPGWMEAKQINDISQKMKYLFDEMKKDIDLNLCSRFIPYIQVHEFEALLFSDISVFEKNFTQQELKMQLLKDAVASADTPEGINNGPNTAPSVRLMQAVEGYDKVVYGACLAYDIGLEKIREKCPSFNDWIQILENFKSS